MVAEKQRQFDQAEQFYAQAMKLRPSLASRALMEFRKRRAAESAPSTAPTTSPSR
jgi:Tfp pilus assembly protein PilF